ncbi:hypothetical protein FQN55_005100 [Onygenales sp. PD_40]|nr:hypothetical protein FQN55_005100 [Onygenales sp. PD_40]KAK2780872.1 hypothetical protein FQN52_002023 [Onygenales sp. PD_12]KAK2805172.1 hypothetical protein FQN51_000695 [Onygenales sp. PD_10]
MPHKVDSYPSTTVLNPESNASKARNPSQDAQDLDHRRTKSLQKGSTQSSRAQPQKPSLRREEAFRVRRCAVEIDARYRLEAKYIEVLFGSRRETFQLRSPPYAHSPHSYAHGFGSSHTEHPSEQSRRQK